MLKKILMYTPIVKNTANILTITDELWSKNGMYIYLMAYKDSKANIKFDSVYWTPILGPIFSTC